jgi:AraC family transcriptional regulator
MIATGVIVIAQYKLAVEWHNYYRREWFYLPDFSSYRRWILLVVESGKFTFESDMESGTVSGGDMLLCPPQTLFTRRVIDPTRFHMVFFEWKTADGTIETDTRLLLQQIGKLKWTLQEHDRFHSTLGHLRYLSHSRLPVELEAVEHFINDLWLVAWLERHKEGHGSGTRGLDVTMAKIKAELDSLALGKVSLTEVAAACHLSISQMTRRFQAAYGINPMAYITHIRLEKAKSLLEKSEFTLEHIAEQCGYDNRCYLSRVFTKHIKLTPSEYRRLHRA